MSEVDREWLRRLVEAATPGPWRVHDEELPLNDLGIARLRPDAAPIRRIYVETAWNHGQVHGPMPIHFVACTPYAEPQHHQYMAPEDAAYIAAAHPAAVLALLDALAAAEAERDALRAALEGEALWHSLEADNFPCEAGHWDGGNERDCPHCQHQRHARQLRAALERK